MPLDLILLANMIFIFVGVLQFPRLMTGTFGPCSLDSVLLEIELCFEVHQHNVPPSWSRKLLQVLKVQMKCFFFIPEFERAAKIRKIAVYRFLISLLVPEL